MTKAHRITRMFTIMLASGALLGALAVLCIGCGGDAGDMSYDRCYDPIDKNEERTLPRTSLASVRVYGPEERPPVFEIALVSGIEMLKWKQLRDFSKSARKIDVTFELTLDIDDDEAVVAKPAGITWLKGHREAGRAVRAYLTRVFESLRFTPYYTGPLLIHIDEDRDEYKYDASGLIPYGDETADFGWLSPVTRHDKREFGVRVLYNVD